MSTGGIGNNPVLQQGGGGDGDVNINVNEVVPEVPAAEAVAALADEMTSTTVQQQLRPVEEEEGAAAAAAQISVDEFEDIAAWRRDPSESFSDWTIRVVKITGTGTGTTGNSLSATPAANRDKEVEDIYHVHRVYLASGPRCSDYFKTLFTTNFTSNESSSSTTRLELQETACKAFPALLDYIYTGHIYVGGCGSSTSGSGDNNDSTTTASPANPSQNNNNKTKPPMTEGEIVALLYLADYLQVSNLIPATTEFIQEELHPRNIHLFAKEALLYGIDWIVETCMTIAAASPKYLCSKLQQQQPARTENATNDGDDDTSPSRIISSIAGTSSTNNNNNNRPTKSPAQQVLEMLPPAQQIELLQMSLKRSVDELNRFKRVPSRWKENIDEAAIATHMPQMAVGNADSEFFRQPYAVSLAGCGLPFPNKVCPVFYFDEALIRHPHDDNDDEDGVDDDGDVTGLFQGVGRLRINNPRSPEGAPRGSSSRRSSNRRTNRAAAAAASRTAGSGQQGQLQQHQNVANNRIILRGTSQNAMHRD